MIEHLLRKTRVPRANWNDFAREVADFLGSRRFTGATEDEAVDAAFKAWGQSQPSRTDFFLALVRLGAISPAIRGGTWTIQRRT